MSESTYELSREHEEFRRSVREFAEAEIAPHAAQWDKDHHFPVDVVQKMGQLGLFGLTAPEEYGGAGEDGDFTSLCVAIEEIGRVDQSMGITLQAGVGLGTGKGPDMCLDTGEAVRRGDVRDGQRHTAAASRSGARASCRPRRSSTSLASPPRAMPTINNGSDAVTDSQKMSSWPCTVRSTSTANASMP